MPKYGRVKYHEACNLFSNDLAKEKNNKNINIYTHIHV